MFKPRRVVTVLVVGVVAAAAYGAAVKVRAINAVGLGASESPECDGFALLNYQEGPNKTEVQVGITDFMANTPYGVRYENGTGGGASNSAAITTNEAGNGTYHDGSFIGNASSNPTVIIYMDENFDGDCQHSEVRGCGGSNCPFGLGCLPD